MNYVLNRIDDAVIKTQGKRTMIIKVPVMGGSELDWLRQNVTVSSVDMNEEDDQYWNVKVLINDIELQQIKKAFLSHF